MSNKLLLTASYSTYKKSQDKKMIVDDQENNNMGRATFCNYDRHAGQTWSKVSPVCPFEKKEVEK